jgi:hypothetical protein
MGCTLRGAGDSFPIRAKAKYVKKHLLYVENGSFKGVAVVSSMAAEGSCPPNPLMIAPT